MSGNNESITVKSILQTHPILGCLIFFMIFWYSKSIRKSPLTLQYLWCLISTWWSWIYYTLIFLWYCKKSAYECHYLWTTKWLIIKDQNNAVCVYMQWGNEYQLITIPLHLQVWTWIGVVLSLYVWTMQYKKKYFLEPDDFQYTYNANEM